MASVSLGTLGKLCLLLVNFVCLFILYLDQQTGDY